MSNLLEKASILLTPTAYDDGKMLSVKPEDGTGDFTFSRNSSATRVTSQGLIEDMQILSGDLVTNGDFSQISSELVTNGDFSQIGPEQIENGDFATDSDWTKAAGWAISGGTANATSAASGSPLSQYVDVGKTYKITYDVVSLSQGAFQVDLSFSGTALGQLATTTGTFTDFITSINPALSIRAVGTTTGSIDNVSAKEVGQDWSLGAGWSIGEGKVIGSSASGTLSQAGIASAGKNYKVTFSITDYSSGTLFVDIGGSSAQTTTSNGLKTFYFTSTSTGSLRFYGGSFTGSIDNVSVKEVGQDWSVTGSDANNYIEFNGSTARLKFLNTSPITQLISSFVMTAGKKYKLTVDVASITSGSIKISGSGIVELFNTVGTTTRIIIPTVNTAIKFYRATSNVDVTLNSVSLIEITDDTNLPRIDYSPYSGAGTCGHWLFEPQSTNLIPYSEDFTQSTWQKQSAGVASAPVVTSNYSISPDGTLNADRVVLNINGGTTSSDFSQLAESVTSNVGDVTNSVWLKSNTSSNYDMTFVNALGSTISIAVTAEWKRFILTSTTTTTSSVFKLRLRGSEPTSDFADVSVWGAQIEEQSFATSYIPTSGSTVTRLKDAAFGAGNSSLINSTEGVLYAEIATLADDSTLKSLCLSDGTSGNRVIINYSNQSNRLTADVRVSAVGQAFMQTFNYTITNFLKIGLKYKENDFAFWVNGTEVATDSSGSTFSANTLNKLSLDNGAGGENFFGKTKCLAVFKEALTDAELTCLTTI